MISVRRHQDYTNPSLPSLTVYQFPKTASYDRMEAFEELTKVLSVARESPHINFHKQGCFIMFPRPGVSNLISSEFYPGALWFTMKWVREGKKFWFIEPLDSEIRAIEIPGQDPDPVYPNSKWAQYLSLIYSLIGGLWRRIVV